MFPAWRRQLREARAAWQNGRYDEAGAVLADHRLREFLPAKQLAQKVADEMLQRATDRLKQGKLSAVWRDLSAADRLGGNGNTLERLRGDFLDQAFQEIRLLLAAIQPGPVTAKLDQLRSRGVYDHRMATYRQTAALLKKSQSSSIQGHFAEALVALREAASILTASQDEPGIMNDVTVGLDAEQDRLTKMADDCRQLELEMHAALASANWSSVLSTADSILTLAPHHSAARRARHRAWEAVGMGLTQPERAREAIQPPISLLRPAHSTSTYSTHYSSDSRETGTVADAANPKRAVIWIDAVGGYLVCLDSAIVIGQPVPGESIALPILADLSRRHGIIRREGGAYVIEPLQSIRIDGRPLNAPTVLLDNQLLQLGENVRIRFHKPHALSMTARLSIESHHKTRPTADGVLLMSDSFVLGRQSHCHVRCRSWEQDIVIYRQQDQFFCRANEPLSIDGVIAGSETELSGGTRVEGRGFSFAWEVLD